MRFVRLGVPPVSPSAPIHGIGLAALALVVLLWGSGPIAIGVGVSPEGGFGPLWLASTRILVAGALLLGVGWARGLPIWPEGGPVRSWIAGIVGWSFGNGAQIVAQTETTASVAAVIVGLSPALAIAFDAAWSRRLPALHHVAAVGLGLGGVALLVGGAGGALAPVPVALLLLAAAGWAFAAVLERQRPLRAAPSVSAGWQMLAGGAGLALAAVATGEPLPAPSTLGWLSWAWLALACAAVGFLAWIEVLRRLPVTLAMTQPTLSTLVAVWLGAALLGEALHGAALVGVGVTLAGAALAAVPAGFRLAARPRLRPRGG